MKTKGKFILLVVTMLVGFLQTEANAQAVTWQKLYQDEPSISRGCGAVQLDDKGFLLLCRKNDQIMVLRIDEKGSLVWRKFYNGTQPSQIIKMNDGNFLIGASTTTKIDVNGNVIWSRNNPSYKINLTNDGGYFYCLGTTNYPLIRRYDSLGFLTWEKIYNSEFYRGAFSNFILKNDNNLILIGNYDSGSVLRHYPFIMETDSMGNINWLKKYPYDSLKFYYLDDVAEINNNQYVVSGSNQISYLIKFDTKGNWEGIRYYSGFDTPATIGSLSKTNDQALIFCGEILIEENSFLRLFKTDYEGNVIWNKLYGIGDASSGDFAIQTKDSGYIALGYRDSFFFSEVYVIKTDVDGNTSPWVGINPNFEQNIIQFELFQNFPNPFNPITNISFIIHKLAHVTLDIYDVTGKEVSKLINRLVSPGNYKITFDGKDLTTGLYFYRLRVNNKSKTYKMLLIK